MDLGTGGLVAAIWFGKNLLVAPAALYYGYKNYSSVKKVYDQSPEFVKEIISEPTKLQVSWDSFRYLSDYLVVKYVFGKPVKTPTQKYKSRVQKDLTYYISEDLPEFLADYKQETKPELLSNIYK